MIISIGGLMTFWYIVGVITKNIIILLSTPE